MVKIETIKSIVPYLGLGLVIALSTILTNGNTLQPHNLRLVLEQSMIILISATGVVFVMSMGSLDFSQGSILGFSSYVAAHLFGYGLAVAILGAILVGAAIGAFNGLLHAKLKVRSFIATICTMFIFRGLTAFLTTNYGPNIPFRIFEIDNFQVRIAVVFFILIAGYVIFRYTKFGRQVRMIGAGEIAANYSGVQVAQVKAAAFIFAGAMAGIGGIFSLIRTGSVTPATGTLLETDVMIALVLGGLPIVGGAKARFSAVFIGALLLAFLGNGLVQIGADPVTQQLVRGLVFLVTIIVTTDRKNTIVNK